MRLLVATDQWAPDVIGGSARVASETTRALADRGHDVVVLAPARRGCPPVERTGRVELHRTIHRGPVPQTFADVLESRRFTRRIGREFDVVLAHQSTVAVGLAGLEIPLAFVFHASVPLEQRFIRPRLPIGRRAASLALSPVFDWLERRALAGSDSVLVLSEYSRRLLLGRYPRFEKQVALVSGGIQPGAFSLSRRDAGRGRLGLSPGERLVISVRRLDPRMGLEELLRATALLRRGGLDFVLAIAGDGILARPLQSLAGQLGLEGRVRFLGRISEDELRDLYAAADLFVLPTIAYEGFGMATIEALASGCPVVGTPAGATPELLEPLDPGLLAQTADPADLASAIERTFERVGESFRRECAAYAERRYGWGHVIVGWEEALARLAR